MARNTKAAAAADLIAAPATASGAAAIAIVRLTGSGAARAAQQIFDGPLEAAEPGRLVLGFLREAPAGPRADQCLAARWAAPRSFTGEEMVEFHLHGSPAIVEAALRACLAAGARLAEPGEFTRRAYLNGKLDLAQAEAVAALTAARTSAAARASLAQLQGGLSARLARVRHDLVQVTAELEAAVDYPEEDIPSLDRSRLEANTRGALEEVQALLASYDRGRRLSAGATVALAGAPNAGKSSLFNALLRRERAIVTPHAGTTRDTIEATVDLRGIPLTLIDTAGLRANPEEIEALGIARSREVMEAADVILFLADPTAPLEEPRAEYHRLAALPHFLVINKTDLLAGEKAEQLAGQFRGKGRAGVLLISTTQRQGLEDLEDALVRHLGAEASEGGAECTVTNARHGAALREAARSLETALEGIAGPLSPEFIVVDLANALSELDSITGKGDLDEDILDAVFSTFCLGK